MVSITIIDSGEEVVDKFTVVIGNQVFTMSIDPRQPNGFNQYAGELEDFDQFVGENRVTVNDEVLKAILERIDQ